MERKIGEIFEYNGEWYQCVEGNCAYCSIQDEACEQRIINDVCRLNRIFKKLGKIEEPPCKSCYFGMVQLYKLPYWNNGMIEPVGCHFTGDGYVLIEIKQNKEDMEEKKLNLKPFDIQKAREGKPVCTRDGRKARIIAFDANGGRPIVALVTECDDEEEIPYTYHCDGSYNCQSIPLDNDLMMLSEKKEGWVNIYKSDNGTYYTGAIFYEKNDALVNTAEIKITTGIPIDCIDTVKINWEE